MTLAGLFYCHACRRVRAFYWVEDGCRCGDCGRLLGSKDQP